MMPDHLPGSEWISAATTLESWPLIARLKTRRLSALNPSHSRMSVSDGRELARSGTFAADGPSAGVGMEVGVDEDVAVGVGVGVDVTVLPAVGVDVGEASAGSEGGVAEVATVECVSLVGKEGAVGGRAKRTGGVCGLTSEEEMSDSPKEGSSAFPPKLRTDVTTRAKPRAAVNMTNFKTDAFDTTQS